MFPTEKKKRFRLEYTSEQLAILEAKFSLIRYIDKDEREKLAEQINVNPRNIKVWWQNRRMKENRQMKDKPGKSKELKQSKRIELQQLRNADIDKQIELVNLITVEPCPGENDVLSQTENPSAMQSITEASTSSPAPLNFASTSSTFPNQWQPSSIQSINTPNTLQLHDAHYHNFHSMSYQQPPEEYISQNNGFSGYEPNSYQMYDQIGSFTHENQQHNGIALMHNATASNLLRNSFSLPCYSDDNSTTYEKISCSSSPSTEFTTNDDHQVKVESNDLPMPNPFDDMNIDFMGVYNDLSGYYHLLE